jgi:signal transduction histidine kinase
MDEPVDIRKYGKTPFLLVSGQCIADVNDEFCNLAKFPSEEILGQDLNKISDMLRCNFNIEYLKCFNSRAFFIFTKFYEPVEVIMHIKHLSDEGYLCLFTEIQNSNIENKMPLFKQLLKNNAIGMAIYSVPDLILLKANTTYLSFFDEPFRVVETTIGRRINEFVTGWTDSPLKKIWGDLLQNGEIFNTNEHPYNHFERGVTYWNATLIPIFENNVMKYVVEMTRDVTGEIQRRNERERIIKMKEEFFSFISHEFRTPLTVMSSVVQLIKMFYKNQLPERILKYINTLNQSVMQQMRLVNNLLDITKSEAGYLKANKKNSDIVSATMMIVDSVSNFAERKNINIQFESEMKELIIGIDEDKYERVILNLMSNAIKFTPEGKSIFVRLKGYGEKVSISIRDEGVGIPTEKINTIFDKFIQADNGLTGEERGTGIGLCLVRALVRALNGEIAVESKIGMGSAFTINLPKCLSEEAKHNTEGQLLGNTAIKNREIEFSNMYLD